MCPISAWFKVPWLANEQGFQETAKFLKQKHSSKNIGDKQIQVPAKGCSEASWLNHQKQAILVNLM